MIAIHTSTKWYKTRSSGFRVWKLLRWLQFYPFSLGGNCYIRHKGMKHQPTDCRFDCRMLRLFIHFLQFCWSRLIIPKSLKTFWQSCCSSKYFHCIELHQFTLGEGFDLFCIVFICAILQRSPERGVFFSKTLKLCWIYWEHLSGYCILLEEMFY